MLVAARFGVLGELWPFFMRYLHLSSFILLKVQQRGYQVVLGPRLFGPRSAHAAGKHYLERRFNTHRDTHLPT